MDIRAWMPIRAHSEHPRHTTMPARKRGYPSAPTASIRAHSEHPRHTTMPAHPRPRRASTPHGDACPKARIPIRARMPIRARIPIRAHDEHPRPQEEI